MLLDLKRRGHEVSVSIPGGGPDFEGIPVSDDKEIRRMVSECDVIFSHLKQGGRALNFAEYYGKAYVHLVHNTNYFDVVRVKNRDRGAGRFVYVVYNSEYTKRTLNYPNPSTVLHPPVDMSRYRVKNKGIKITLLNLCENKGGLFFNELIKLMPDYQFLGVEGAYAKQEKTKYSNVTYLNNTPDIKKVYAQTRVLLMPSQKESYGRAAVEAMASGIPVIASPTEGLKESLGDAGIFCDLRSPLRWVEAIQKLDDDNYYKEQSKKCVARSKEIETATRYELDQFNNFLKAIETKEL
jgi:glycosyltransferase involved in cell wall biosynthesis